MKIGYTFRYLNKDDGIMCMIVMGCLDDNDAVRAAVRGFLRPYVTLEIDRDERLLWRGSMADAQAHANAAP